MDHLFDRVWHALGRFTFAFAETEDQLRELMFDYAGGGREISKLLIGDSPVTKSVDKLRSLASQRDQDLPIWLNRSLDQLIVIARSRNLILHHTPSMRDNGIEVSDYSSKTLKKGRAIYFPISDMEAMTYDLKSIKWILSRAFNPWEEDKIERTWLFKMPKGNTVTPYPREDRTFRYPSA